MSFSLVRELCILLFKYSSERTWTNWWRCRNRQRYAVRRNRKWRRSARVCQYLWIDFTWSIHLFCLFLLLRLPSFSSRFLLLYLIQSNPESWKSARHSHKQMDFSCRKSPRERADASEIRYSKCFFCSVDRQTIRNVIVLRVKVQSTIYQAIRLCSISRKKISDTLSVLV